MKTEFVRLSEETAEETFQRAGKILREGGLVAFPTETVYGLGANALDPDAAAKIYAAKGRPADNPLIVHVADPSEAEDLAVTTPVYYALAQRFMPGPLTVILDKKPRIPDSVTGGLIQWQCAVRIMPLQDDSFRLPAFLLPHPVPICQGLLLPLQPNMFWLTCRAGWI